MLVPFTEANLNIFKLMIFVCAIFRYYRPPEGGRLYDMKVVSGYAFLRTYYV